MPTERIDCFLDTNILVLAAQTRTRDEQRTVIARELALGSLFGLSAQTLAEFYEVTTRNAAVQLSPAEIDRWIGYLSAFPCLPIDQNVVRGGIALSRRYRIRYYDAALLFAAGQLGAPIFYSEDLGHNQLYGSVRVVNPFRES